MDRVNPPTVAIGARLASPTGADAEVRAGTAKTHGSHVIAYDAVGGIRRAAVGLEREVIDAAAASPDLTIHMPGSTFRRGLAPLYYKQAAFP